MSLPTINNRHVEITAMAAIVFATRLPFLGPGFGLQPDAWRVALAARAIRSSGHYVASRYGANPLHELLAASVLEGLPLALNLASALGAVGLALFVQHALRDEPKVLAWLAPLAVVGLPAVWVESVAGKDYLIATALALGAVVLASEKRPVLAGVLLGLALGFRLPMVLFAPACVLAHPQPFSRDGWMASGRGAAAVTAMGLLALSPALAMYGLNILKSDVLFGHSLTRLTRQVAQSFGVLGAASLALGLAGLRPGRAWLAPNRKAGIVRGSSAVVLIHIALYAWNPGSSISSYVVPVAPFLILLIAFGPRPKLAKWALAGCTVSALFLGLSRPGPLREVQSPVLRLRVSVGTNVALHPFFGRIMQDAFLRRREAQILEAAVKRIARLPSTALVVSGGWRPKLSWYAPDAPIVYTVKPDQVGPNTEVWTMPDAVQWNERLTGFRPQARPLVPTGVEAVRRNSGESAEGSR